MVSALKQHQVKTQRPRKEESEERRLPHERDESDDSQVKEGEHKEIQQAYKDLQQGLVDTDLRGARGVDQVVNKTAPTVPEKVTKK